MSRTKKGTKPPGYEFWSKRPGNGGRGKAAKIQTHRSERATGRRETANLAKRADVD